MTPISANYVMRRTQTVRPIVSDHWDHQVEFYVAYPKIYNDEERWPYLATESELELRRMVAIVESTDERLSLEEWNERLRRKP